MLRITMMYVLQGEATVDPPAAKHVLGVVLLFPVVMNLCCVTQHQPNKEEAMEVLDSGRSWFESWPCHLCH